MASEIKVDTVSEKTSGSGVTIDGLLIKDGGISGDVSLIGTTPTFTIGLCTCSDDRSRRTNLYRRYSGWRIFSRI